MVTIHPIFWEFNTVCLEETSMGHFLLNVWKKTIFALRKDFKFYFVIIKRFIKMLTQSFYEKSFFSCDLFLNFQNLVTLLNIE